ncbi:MAG TPA: GNAT family N-acetyltransferase [Solirubrobacteraceae bacterium]|nr:GNAT family N-acetyltransferase [Solirubrobacteraceae bacterium]
MTNSATGASIELRPIEPADGEECARIVYEAFGRVHDHHRFPREFPTLDVAREVIGACIEHPSIWGVVAERDGRIAGSNFLDERGPIRGVGPISVDPSTQAQGVGRRLMEAVLKRGEGARGIRLLQETFNLQALSLYASLGFEVKEPAVVMSGRPRSDPPAGIDVRPLEEGDLDACDRLCRSVHGFERTEELRDALGSPVLAPVVAVRDGRLTAWGTTFASFPAVCAVAETERDMRALISGAAARAAAPVSFLLPTRQAGLMRWCLREGLRFTKPMTYMSIGEYRDPDGCWIPSVLY